VRVRKTSVRLRKTLVKVQYTFTHKKYIEQQKITTNVKEWGPCPVFASFTQAFALQLRKKHGKLQ
jgi:hypothetical protein